MEPIIGANLRDKITDIVCEECGHKYFQQVWALKRINKFYTGDDKDSVMPIPLHRCDKCGHMNQDLSLKDKNDKKIQA